MLGMPKRGSGENARAMSVQPRNSANGIATRGHRSGRPDSKRTTNASARRICEAAIERRIATAEADASQRASLFRKGGGTNLKVSRTRNRPAFGFPAFSFQRYVTFNPAGILFYILATQR